MHVLSFLDCPRQLQLVATQHTLLPTLYVDLKRWKCSSVWSDGISRHNKSTGRMIDPCCFQIVRRVVSSTQASAAEYKVFVMTPLQGRIVYIRSSTINLCFCYNVIYCLTRHLNITFTTVEQAKLLIASKVNITGFVLAHVMVSHHENGVV